MNRILSGVPFVAGAILLVALARFIFQQWVMQAAADWRVERDKAREIAEYSHDPPPSPVPWGSLYAFKPWYVFLAEKWEARRDA